MVRIAMVAAALSAATTAYARDRPLGVGVQGRPHAGQTAGDMLLYRSHLTRAEYNRLRAMNERRAYRR